MTHKNTYSRRDFIKLSAGTVAVLSLETSLGACSTFGGGSDRPIKIGYISNRKELSTLGSHLAQTSLAA